MKKSILIILAKIKCKIKKHDYFVTKKFTNTIRQVGCKNCSKLWAMSDDAKAFLEWDNEFEQEMGFAFPEAFNHTNQ